MWVRKCDICNCTITSDEEREFKIKSRNKWTNWHWKQLDLGPKCETKLVRFINEEAKDD